MPTVFSLRISHFPFPISSFQKSCKSYPPEYLNNAESFHKSQHHETRTIRHHLPLFSTFNFELVIVGARTRPLSDARNFRHREERHREEKISLFSLFYFKTALSSHTRILLHTALSPLFELYRTQENLGLFQQFTEPKKI